ncbi:hypothetical protein BCV70DRAFT_224812 [Testicularia cyperi]|uniref:Uncharacterized protein n=1 Tax=Testicularia cyperi TaxID=1882483 RepID=A0A317Y142_9BASI|nr:hypothetical protein BCV70DRAFT_224812 [Testicularia cyperi]
MLLKLLSWAFAAAVAIGLLVCIALGLLSLSQYIETHSGRARRLGLNLLYASSVIQIVIVVFDDVPLVPILPNLLASLLHRRALSHTQWPYVTAVTGSQVGRLASTAASLLLPLMSHIWLVRHHTFTARAWSQHRYDTIHRAKLPGGRLDWDIDPTAEPTNAEMSNLEVCAVLTICIWSVPIWRILGRVAAADWEAANDGFRGRDPEWWHRRHQ